MAKLQRVGASIVGLLLASAATAALAAPPPWMNKARDPNQRASLLEAQMTTEEKLTIVHGPMGRSRLGIPKPERALGSAGFIRASLASAFPTSRKPTPASA